MRQASGFTLIELLMVLVIVGILAAVAVPQYSGYVKKAKFSEVVAATAPYKLGVEDCYMRRADLADCDVGSYGVPAAAGAAGYVTSVTVANGIITATSTLTDGASAYTYVLTPTPGTTATTWAATGTCVAVNLC